MKATSGSRRVIYHEVICPECDSTKITEMLGCPNNPRVHLAPVREGKEL